MTQEQIITPFREMPMQYVRGTNPDKELIEKISIAAMSAIISGRIASFEPTGYEGNFGYRHPLGCDSVAEDAVGYAQALVKKLNEL